KQSTPPAGLSRTDSVDQRQNPRFAPIKSGLLQTLIESKTNHPTLFFLWDFWTIIGFQKQQLLSPFPFKK
ncbi:MAG: hypothetical protein AAF146_26100, partial [Bacteroidota bacterium]